MAVLLAISGAVWLSACSGDRPTDVDATASASKGVSGNAPSCQVASKSQLGDLFAPSYQGQAMSQFAHIDNDVRKQQNSQAVSDMFALWKYTLDSYYAGNLNGGTSSQTQSATLAFGRGLYCLVGLDGSTLTLSATPLDPNSVVKVVFPSTADQTVVTGSQNAGVMIPGGTLSQPVTIAISILPGPYTFPAGPLNTKLDQYGQFFEFKVVPAQTFNTPVVAATCLQTAAGGPPPASVDIAHNVGQGIEILPTHPVSFLTCGPLALAPQPSVFQLASHGEFGKALKRLGSATLNAFSPTPAYALVASGFGGTTKSFSPFGGVDTAVVVRVAAGFPAQPQSAAAGSNVAAAPSALIETSSGHTPLGGASVTMTITSGGGSIGPISSSTAVTTTTLTSNGTTGLATVPNWTLGVGPANSLTANASFALPATISGFLTTAAGPGSAIVVSGNPLTFTATSTDVVPYQAGGYVYTAGIPDIFPGFEQPNFSPSASDWQTGTGAFGSPNLGASCPSLTSTVATSWPNNPASSSDLLLRKSFTLPGWWTAGLSIGIAIDNDFKAYVDGTNVTPTNVAGYNPTTGFVSHDNCATRDSFVIPINLTGGTHTLAVRARDRGTAAYADTKVAVRQ